MNDRRRPELPSLDDVKAAQARIAGHIHRTPLLSSRCFGEPIGARVFFKAESLQRAGSFKIRGALNAILRAREAGRLSARGVLTYSSGNHGQGVALAARIAGCPAVVVVPEDILDIKRAAIEGYGARVVLCGRTSEDRRVRGEELARETGALVIPPFDHPDIIAGQGTVGMEILEDEPSVEAILVPVGGGGLVAGIAIAAGALSPRVRVYGVEPDSADSMRRSLDAGEPVTIPASKSIADGLRAVRPGDLTFAAARAHVAAIWRVRDDEIRAAQRALLERSKLLVEPSGSAAAAALAAHRQELEAKTVAVVLSGGNAEIEEIPPR